MEKERPKINYALAYQRYRTELNEKVIELQKKYPLPNYMIEGILTGVLSEIKSGVIAETVHEHRNYIDELEHFYTDDEITE